MPDDATESVATHSSRLLPSISRMPQLQPRCSAALVPKFSTMNSGMKAQASLETTIEPHDLVYYLDLEPARVRRWKMTGTCKNTKKNSYAQPSLPRFQYEIV